MKNKGFTLIEILAVIIILALVAIIAIPSILGTIENTKKKTAEARAGEYIEAVEKEATMNEMDGLETLKSGKYKVSKLAEYDLEFSGKHPESGYVVMSDYKVSTYSLTIGEYTITFDGTNKTVTKKVKSNNTIIYSFTTDTVFVGDTLDINGRKITTTKSIDAVSGVVSTIDETTKNLTGVYSTNRNDVLNVPTDLSDLTSEKRANYAYLKITINSDNVVEDTQVCSNTKYGEICSNMNLDTISLSFEERNSNSIDLLKINYQEKTSEYNDVEIGEENYSGMAMMEFGVQNSDGLYIINHDFMIQTLPQNVELNEFVVMVENMDSDYGCYVVVANNTTSSLCSIES